MSASLKVIEQISLEIRQIDELLRTYSDLLSRVQQRQPDTVEIAAVASVIHSFYNGLENIFLTIAKLLDENVPSGRDSHRKLLNQMTRATQRRNAVLSDGTAEPFADYLAFRHFYRHSYSFVIDWEKLKELVVPLDQNWAQIKNELLGFFDHLRSANGVEE